MTSPNQGFVMIPGWLLDKRPSGNAISAYGHLARRGTFSPGDGTYEECRPSMATLAKDMGVSPDTARRALQELVTLGAIVGRARFAADGSQLPTAYRVIFGSLTEPAESADTAAASAETSDPPGKSNRGGLANPIGGASQVCEGGTPNFARPPLANSRDNQEPLTNNPHQEEQNLAAPPAEARRDDECPDVEIDKPDTAQTILADWLDYCASHEVIIPSRLRGQYAKTIKDALNDGITVKLIKVTLARMLDDGAANRPALLSNRLVAAQTGPERRDRATHAGANLHRDDPDEMPPLVDVVASTAARNGAMS